jgi:hypothetical protein
MTHRERLLAAIARKPVDFAPCAPFFNPLTAAQRLGHAWQFPFGPSEEEMIRYCVEQLDIGPAVVLPIGDYHPNFFMSLYYEPADGVTSRVWVEGDQIHKMWKTPAGDLHAAVRRDRRWPHGLDIPFFSDFNIAHFVAPWLESESDLECLRHILRPLDTAVELDRVRFTCQYYKDLADGLQLAAIAHIGMGLTGAMQLCGSQQLCLLVLERPELVEQYLALDHARNLRHIELAVEVGADIIRRNGFYETCDFYSPATLKRLLRPSLLAEANVAHAAGRLCCYTVNTGVMPMLDYLASLKFDCLMHLELAGPGVDPPRIRDRLGASKSFWTGPSNVHHLPVANEDSVRRAVDELFATFGHQGLIVTPSPSMHSVMPWSNFLALVDQWRRRALER